MVCDGTLSDPLRVLWCLGGFSSASVSFKGVKSFVRLETLTCEGVFAAASEAGILFVVSVSPVFLPVFVPKILGEVPFASFEK